MHSEQINEMAAALAKAQGQMRAASKDAVNPHLKNSYATLSSYIEAAREALSTNNLAFSQILSQVEDGLMLETILMHSSGQWLQSEVLIRVATDNRGINGAQALGSALTYYKRYALSAMLGISVSDEDDDANGVTGNEVQYKQKPAGRPNVDTATGEVTNGKPKAPQPAKSTETAQKAKAPTTGEELLELVNNHVLVIYRDVNHLRNAIRIISKNNRWTWPAPDDREGWAEAFKLSKQYAEAKTNEAKAPVEEEIAF